MQLTSEPARLTRFAILAVAGATALSVGACGSSNKSNDAKPPAASSPAAASGQDKVRGLIASVSGNAVQVTQTTGAVTVDFSPSVQVVEYTGAQLSDIVPGSCVSVASSPLGPRCRCHGRITCI